MEKSKISVVLPVYNGEKYLAQAIESILNQTYKNIELIVVNDCSTDDTKKIAEEFVLKDQRVRIINNPRNYKLPRSLNEGFRNATGDYYTWTSDDNYYMPEAFKKMYNFLEANTEYICVCTDFEKIFEESDEINQIVRLNISPTIMIFQNCVGACFLYKKEVADQIGGYDETSFLAEDYDYWLKMMLKGDIGHIAEILYYYRLHPNNLTMTKAKEVSEVVQKLQEKYIPIYCKKFPEIKEEIAKKRMEELKKKIFSIEKNSTDRIIRILGMKINVRRKNKCKGVIDYENKCKISKRLDQSIYNR